MYVYISRLVTYEWGVQGQSGQAIKLFQITPYVNYFQTLKQSYGKYMVL